MQRGKVYSEGGHKFRGGKYFQRGETNSEGVKYPEERRGIKTLNSEK